MSVQETNLAAIANAIRKKDGSTGPIPAADFAARILAISSGGSGADGFAVPLVVTVEKGASVTAVHGDITVSGTAGESGSLTLTLTAPGEWTVTASLNGKQKSTTVIVDSGYEAVLRMSSNLPEGVSLPDGYVELEYIENPNLGYIYQCKNLSAPYIFEIEAGESATGYLFGASNRYTQSTPKTTSLSNIRISSSDGKTSVSVYEGSKSASLANDLNMAPCATLEAAGKVKIETDMKSFLKVNGQEATFTPSYFSQAIALPAKSLFCCTYTTRSSSAAATTTASLPLDCKLYSMTCTTSKNYWAPCKNPDGQVGLYDTANQKFYPSHVTDKPFVAGPLV